ncbi:winged helix-turn-helix transcriptional regulator [Streptomyces piniterrae]|uniref:Winged helix-turn-helix transcriptional regulator n=1 Tax=Streptomyces piniterrae TaxID=2571125 RepID=A0A4U0NKL4_9ACTN|nr:winged helix-turn-helix domain-containing protein [Streptomyces piniterrae]TJZ54312.1 winged helix-turn-helix transcriptional regulator [Streptomyces piniterrae]
MQRIHFTAADVARTRLKTTSGPLIETAFAYGLLGRCVGPPYVRWYRQVAKRLSARPPARSGGIGVVADPEVLLRLIERNESGDSGDAGATHQVSWVSQLSAYQEAAGLSEVWREGIAPYWDRMVAYLEAECEARGRVVMCGGVELLLATLHPRITWRSQVLEIPGGPDEDVFLDGRGLVLIPSVFLNHRPAQIIGTQSESGELVLAFGAPPDVQRAASLWDVPDDTAQSLGALVGQTRAAALRVLRATCTTSELAERLGISAASASQHTKVLRETGLITTRRIRNTVLHAVTPLGLALLDGLPAHTGADRVPGMDRAPGMDRVPGSDRAAGAMGEARRHTMDVRIPRQVVLHAS